MPAQNLTSLLDFESQFESATQAVLEAAGVNAFISQQSVNIPLISTGIGVDVGAALDELDQVPGGPNWPAGTPLPQEYFRYTAALELTASVPRDQNGATVAGVPTLFAQLRGLIRATMLRVLMPYNDANLPNLRVTDIAPAGTTNGFMPAKGIDFCSIRYRLSFEIKNTAWPSNWNAQ